MKVDNPDFHSEHGWVMCAQCPLDEKGASHIICSQWGDTHSEQCPTKETYAEACAAAETALKEET